MVILILVGNKDQPSRFQGAVSLFPTMWEEAGYVGGGGFRPPVSTNMWKRERQN